ncbi:MAG: hypothetical protein AAGE43_04190 [Pseudomonadota bacterium]
MRHAIYRERDGQDAFTDLLFNALLGFAFMFVAAFALIRDPDSTGKIDSKAEVLVTVRWPDRHPDDVDTLVEGPEGGLVWYHNRDSGLMHLDRDDRGLFADRIQIDGREVSNPINQETVTVRALQPGEYVVNVLHYQANYADPLPVTVKVEKLNPSVSLVFYGTRELTGVGDEQTAVRFTIDAEGNVSGISELPKTLLLRAVKDGNS